MNIQTMLKVSVCFNSVLIFIVLYGISSGIVTHLSEEIKEHLSLDIINKILLF